MFDPIAYINDKNKFGARVGLDGMRRLLEMVGRPDRRLKFIHVAGTNGKGSTCAMLASCLMEAGYSVGLYTSPFIEVFNERIRINGELISDDMLSRNTLKVKACCDELVAHGEEQPTTFEILTAVSLLSFVEAEVDIVVYETGLGGLNDCTNVIEQNEIAVITSIAMDHMQILGDTLEEIAFQKAGIIKPGCPVLVYDAPDSVAKVFETRAREENSEFFRLDNGDVYVVDKTVEGSIMSVHSEYADFVDLKVALVGEHQVFNAALALTALCILRNSDKIRISDEQIVRGFEKVKWPGRFEMMNRIPCVIIDGAHNEEGVSALVKNVDLLGDVKKYLVLEILADKEWRGMVDILRGGFDHIIVTQIDYPRALSADELNGYITSNYDIPTTLTHSVDEAISQVTDENAAYVFAGSLYFIGEARTKLKRHYL